MEPFNWNEVKETYSVSLNIAPGVTREAGGVKLYNGTFWVGSGGVYSKGSTVNEAAENLSLKILGKKVPIRAQLSPS